VSCSKSSSGSLVVIIVVVVVWITSFSNGTYDFLFDTIPECDTDTQTDRQTQDDGIYRA